MAEGRRRRSASGRGTQQVTLKEVAEAAGVSAMTVSNVVHDRANVSAPVRRRVEAIVRELGYVPNRAAQELAGVARPHFGLLYPSVINPFIGAVIVGSMSAASRLRVDVSIQLAQLEDGKALRATMRRMEEGGIDGFLLPSPIAEFVAATFGRKKLTVPAVAIATGFAISGMASVRTDEFQASFDLVSMLLDLGHTRIAHLAGPERQSGSVARWDGYAAALQARGIVPRDDYLARTEFRFQDGIAAADALLDAKPRITAIFAANDTLAASVLAAAQRRRIAVPESLSVVGYDDAPIAEQVWPALTTVHQDAREMTERAVEILERGVRAWRADPSLRIAEEVVVPYRIVNRASVGRAPDTTG